jgi:hypothetical protein
MKRQQLPGFTYDGKRKRAIFDGFVPGTKCKVRRQRTIEDVTRDQALEAWKEFRAELASGRAIRGPLTLRQFVEGGPPDRKAGELGLSAKRDGRDDASETRCPA